MKLNRLPLFIILFLAVLLASCSSKSWVSSFVVWDGYIYEISNEYVNKVDKKIGEVTKYSNQEGTYSGNFSNEYKKGTKYFSIKGINTNEAIAVEEKLASIEKLLGAENMGSWRTNKARKIKKYV